MALYDICCPISIAFQCLIWGVGEKRGIRGGQMTRMNRRDTASDLSPPDFLLCANWKADDMAGHDDYFMFPLYL